MHEKILLIRPQNLYGMQNYPPFGLILIGSALRRQGYTVQIMVGDGTAEFTLQAAEAAEGALFVGLTATTAEIQDTINLSRALRRRHGHRVPLVWGGWHVTLFPEQMEASDLVDFAVVGDGEEAILKIAESLRAGAGCGHGDQALPARSGKIVQTVPVDLDSLPIPDYELAPDLESFVTRPLNDKFQEYCSGPLRWLPYQSSRGCPYSCAFCINPSTRNRKYRPRNPVKTAAELAEIVNKYRVDHIKIIDDNFFVQKGRVWEIFQEVERLGVKFTWDAECRIDYLRPGFVDDAMFAFLKRNGLVQLTFGIESGSLETLKRMRKGGNSGPEYAVRAVARCAEYGIVVRGSFILDIPGDTSQDIIETVKLIRRLRQYPKFACGVHTYRPYPKSPLCEDLILQGKFYQPESLEAWNDEAAVRQFTDTGAKRVWQGNYHLSSKVSFYESLESGFWLKPHQLTNQVVRSINNAFISLAKFRNRHQFYALPLDKALYLPLKDFYMRRLKRTRLQGQGVAKKCV